ncbi:serine hydrolase [Lutispora saccharofermentans]|uniref:Serine hydrolase n=1 Tax=Lutispora saccharofermentans TaxID=3024236 RepID=A0ABT1NFZ4_9FIRM|nr:serine hydrolase [Lutispora saccharofermentans]MCQ1530177.1 serine hydrolase [Lutispora saccharofermentans]
MRRTGIISVVILMIGMLALSGCSVKTSGSNEDFSEKADEYIEALNNLCTRERIHGNILVAKGGKILFSKGYGKADYDKNIEFTEDTIFLIGSNTKPITALAIMQLEEKGLLKLSDPISKYIPSQAEGDKITIEHLLTHTSGIKRDAEINFHEPVSRDELINKIASQALDFEPGTRYQYSNGAFSLLACIIEKVSGETYEEYLKKNIFEPIGMKNTGAAASNAEFPHMASGYKIFDSHIEKVTSTIYDVSAFLGSGNIYSTTKDLYLLYKALNGDIVIKKETIERMYAHGHGLGVGELNGYKWMGYNGLLDNGYSSTVMRFPDEELTVISLMNVSNKDNINLNMAQVLSFMALGEKYDLPVKREKIQLDKEKLERLSGRYLLDNGNVMTVRREANHLVLEPSAIKNILIPYSETEFYTMGSEYRLIKFNIDAEGKVEGLNYKECVYEIRGKKM